MGKLTNGRVLAASKLNRQCATFVIWTIDEILAETGPWTVGRDSKFVELGRYLAKFGQDNTAGRATYSHLMSFWRGNSRDQRARRTTRWPSTSNCPKSTKVKRQQVGWAKAAESSEDCEAGRSGLRLCDLVAQGARAPQGSIQAGSFEAPDGEGNGAPRP